MASPLIASFDLECSNLDPMFAILLCADIKPWGQDEHITFINRQRGADDFDIVQETITELSKYQILIAHNGVFFDRKFLNGRALYHGIPLLNPRGKIIDPWRLAKNHLNFRGNSLDRLSDYLRCANEKTKISGEIWNRASMERGYTARGDEALEYIVEHCVKDVDVLEEVYDKMKELTGAIHPWGSA